MYPAVFHHKEEMKRVEKDCMRGWTILGGISEKCWVPSSHETVRMPVACPNIRSQGELANVR